MQSKRKYGTMKNRLKTARVTSNPVAKAMMVSTEVNTKPSVIPNKKKHNRNKEKQKWKMEQTS